MFCTRSITDTLTYVGGCDRRLSLFEGAYPVPYGVRYNSYVLTDEKTVLLDFYADWCGPCRMVSPIIDEIAEENPDILVGKVNVDRESALAEAFGVSSIPTLIVLKNGNVVNRVTGARPKAQILALIASAV